MIFLDLGAHVGESVKFFRKHHPRGNSARIYSFEALPENIQKLNELSKVWGNVVMPYAVGVESKEVDFYTGLPESGSVFKEKRTGGLDGRTKIRVNQIDFPAWFAENIDPDQEVIVKMNIEGAEYGILLKMFYDGLLPWVDKWYIQWHYSKIGMGIDEHEIIANLVEWNPWGAMLPGWENSEEWQRSLL